jgi:5-methyltetrahydrofolate--homocysteine methyltransferase
MSVNTMSVKDTLKTRLKSQDRLLLDGSYGALFILQGYNGARVYESNLKNQGFIEALYKRYVEAGSELVLTNTFSITDDVIKTLDSSLDALMDGGIKPAEAVREETDIYIALNLTQGFYDKVSDDEIRAYYQLRIEPYIDRVDGVFFETFSDSNQLRIAVETAKQADPNKAVFAGLTYTQQKKTWNGEGIEGSVERALSAGPDVIGLNCTLNPYDMNEYLIEDFLKAAGDVRTFAEPNRGQPIQTENGLGYEMSASKFAEGVKKIYERGITVIGGCCGSDPECIEKLSAITS